MPGSRRAAPVPAIALIIVAAALLSACGGGAADTAALPGRQPPAAPPPAPTEDRRPLVVIDPGHGGAEVGAANHGVIEKQSNLEMALRVERYLVEAGVRVVLTRREDSRVSAQEVLAPASGFGATRRDLQARIDIANDAGADLFVSIHSNGSTDPSQRGVEVWYDPQRPFGERSRALAERVQANVLEALAAYGYDALDRGVKDDTCFRMRSGRCFTLFVLGPPRTMSRAEIVRRGLDPEALGLRPEQEVAVTRATEMPGVLVELLFISNAGDAAILGAAAARDPLARAVAAALLETLDEVEGG